MFSIISGMPAGRSSTKPVTSGMRLERPGIFCGKAATPDETAKVADKKEVLIIKYYSK